jgi:hypothetical protein
MAVTIEVIERCKREILEGLDELIRIAEESPNEHLFITAEFTYIASRKVMALEDSLFTARNREQET